MHWLTKLAILVAAIASCSIAFAQERQAVLIQGLADADPLLEQIRVELSTIGLASATDTADARSYAAIIRVRTETGESGAVEIWLVEGTSRPRLYDAISLGEQPSPRIAALQIIELLRAALREKSHGAATPPTSRSIVDEPVPAPAPPQEPPVVTAGVGAAMSASPGGLSPSVGGMLRLRAHLGGGWGIGALAVLPVAPLELTGPEGRAEAWIGLGGAGPSFAVQVTSDFTVQLEAGAGGVVLYTRGFAVAPRTSQRDTATSALGYVGSQFDFSVTDRVLVGGGMVLAGLFKQADVRFVERQVATLGPPLLVSYLAVSFQF